MSLHPRAVDVVATATLAAALLLSSCKPNYPKCSNDSTCRPHGEVCIFGQCQECRADADCKLKYPDEKRECHEGRCDARLECQLDTDCAHVGPGLVCHHNQCVPECNADSDCAPNQHCVNQKCFASSCRQNADCGPDKACVNGTCTLADNAANSACQPVHPGDVVNLEMVHFEFNKYDLTQEARQQLEQVLSCLKQAPESLRLVVEGHCDDRGTQEYNLALGEKRAHAVTAYFKQMGFAARRLTTRSKGENEPLCTETTENCFNLNRRVQFIQRNN